MYIFSHFLAEYYFETSTSCCVCNQHIIFIEVFMHTKMLTLWFLKTDALFYSFRRQYQKKSGRWTVYAVKVAKDYSYIPDLQAAILQKRLQSDMGMPRCRLRRPDDPRTLGLLPNVPPPSIDSILESHVSRGLGMIC